MTRSKKPSRPETPPPPRVAEICAEFGIEIIGRHARRGPMQTCAIKTMESILRQHGEGHLRFTLMTIVEAGDNSEELVEQTMWAMSDLILGHPAWAETGSQWMEAFDTISLADLRTIAKANMGVAQQRQGISTMVFERLVPIFGPRHKQHLEQYAPREESSPAPPA